MIARIAAHSLLLFYAAGVLLLPGGDFGLLRDLPSMYAQCKATEDKDMTPLDFLTDHLTCFDALIDNHPPGDEQRSHTPPPNVRVIMPLVVEARSLPSVSSMPSECLDITFNTRPDLYRHHHSSLVFRPPVA